MAFCLESRRERESERGRKGGGREGRRGRDRTDGLFESRECYVHVLQVKKSDYGCD
jgi:hypothetical protein